MAVASAMPRGIRQRSPAHLAAPFATVLWHHASVPDAVSGFFSRQPEGSTFLLTVALFFVQDCAHSVQRGAFRRGVEIQTDPCPGFVAKPG